MTRLNIVLLLLLMIVPANAQSDDIPNNCPYQSGAFYQENLIPRFDALNQQLELVDWASGTQIYAFQLDTDVVNYHIQLWSPECQYLAVAFSKIDTNGIERWDTYLWDVVNRVSITTFTDARLSPYPLQWDTNSTQLLVGTRFGAYLWTLSGAEIWLTSEADYNAQSFQPRSVLWDYSANQVSGVLTISPFGRAYYDLSTGELLRLDSPSGTPIDIETSNYTDVTANENGEPYACQIGNNGNPSLDNLTITYSLNSGQLVLQDRGTRDVIRVIDTFDISEFYTQIVRRLWSAQCRFLLVSFGRANSNTYIYDMTTGERVLALIGYKIHQVSTSPVGHHLVMTTRNGANLYNLLTGEIFPLIPNVRTSSLGSGRVWAYDSIDWDMSANQVRLGSTLSSFIYSTRIYEIQTFDITTGALVSILDRDGEASDTQTYLATETQRTAPYGCRWQLQYQVHNQRVVIQDVVTRDLLTVVQDDIITEEFRYIGRSPDCRYVAAGIWDGANYDTHIWDLADNTLVGIFADAQSIPHHIQWSPYGGYALVRTRNGGYLWHLPTDTQTLITTAVNPRNYDNFHQITWDMLNNQLLAVPVDNHNAVVAYDLGSGNIVGEFHLAGRTSPVEFFQLDANRLIVFTPYSLRESDDRLNGFAIWERDSGNNIQFAMDFYVAPNRIYPLFSPDNTLLVTRSRNYVYVWDLNALEGSSPYLPNFVHPLESPNYLQFIDNQTITTCALTTSREQSARRIDEVTHYFYDIRTGTLVETRVETLPHDYWYRPC